jgi:tRNA-splicing endonuclease subunit Sen54
MVIFSHISRYLADCGLLELFWNGLPLSIEQTYSLLQKEGDRFNMNRYLAYVHLKRLGFVVLRTSLYDKQEIPEKSLSLSEFGEVLEVHHSYFILN